MLSEKLKRNIFYSYMCVRTIYILDGTLYDDVLKKNILKQRGNNESYKRIFQCAAARL